MAIYEAGQRLYGLLKANAVFDRPLTDAEAIAYRSYDGVPILLKASHQHREPASWLFTAPHESGLAALWIPEDAFEVTAAPVREVRFPPDGDGWEDHLPDHVLAAWETFSPEQKGLLQRWAEDLATVANDARWDRDE